MEKKTLHISIILLALTLIFGFVITSRLGYINDNLNNQINELRNKLSSINSEIADIENNVRDELKKQSSILSSYDIQYGEINVENLTVVIDLKVIPKEYSGDTEMTINIGDLRIKAEPNGSEYTASCSVPVTKKHSITISITTDGMTKNETLSEQIDAKYMLLYKAKADIRGNIKYKENKLTFEDNDISIYFSLSEGMQVTKARLLAAVGADEVWEKDITGDFRNTTELVSYTFSKTFDIAPQKEFFLYADVTQSNGLTYRLLLKGIKTQKNDMLFTEVNDNISILDREGNKIVFEE